MPLKNNFFNLNWNDYSKKPILYQMKKNVLITGTSTGVGLETALLFAQNGYKVFATMRNLKKASALKKSRRRSKTRHRTL